METQKIKAILSAVKHKSLSKAAEEVSYTPSAMSHIADAVERELGVKILARTPLGVTLTKEGEELYPHMTALIRAERALLQAASTLTEAKEYHLRIGTFSSISQNILPEIIGDFRRAHPEVRISMAVEDNLQDWLENGQADVIFTDELTFGKGEWVPIKEDPYVAVVSTEMLRGRRSVEREELYGYTYISTSEKVLDDYFDRKRFAEVLEFESVDNVSVLYMVQEGLGISVLPSLMVSGRIRGVKALKLEPPISRTIGFAFKKDAVLTHAAKIFIDYLKGERGEA